MSDRRRCTACGLPFDTGITSDQQYCGYCDDTTTYTPAGVPDVEEGDTVTHLYFTGTVHRIAGRRLNGDPSTVEIRLDESSWGGAGEYVRIDVTDLNPA